MTKLGDLRDAIFGRAIRWAGRHWWAARDENERFRQLYRDLVNSMADTIHSADGLGRGYREDGAIQEGNKAELKVGTLASEMSDEQLVTIVRSFRSDAARVFGRHERDSEWTTARAALRSNFDRAVDRIRVLQSKL